jgi:Domain of unknown function (DUF4134)
MKKLLIPIFTLANTAILFAQTNDISTGATALEGLTGDLENYIDPVTKVIYMAAIIVGLIGAFKVYTAWQGGKEGVMILATGWFGSCLFILVANTLLRGFFVN